MIPKKEKVLERARELYVQHCYRNGCPELANTNPECSELLESGFYQAALSSLMTSTEAKNEQWLKEAESVETSKFQFDAKEAMQTTCFVSGSRGVGKSDICMRIAEQLQNHGIIVIVFDLSCDWLKRSSTEQYFTVKPYSDLQIPEHSIIFDISQLTPNQAQQHVEHFCKKLFEFQVVNSAKRFYIVFEEAQIYFPLSALSSKNTQNTVRLLTVGRNLRFYVCSFAISRARF